MIHVGLDDTDVVGTRGTNQLARAILKAIGPAARDAMICRHQLFFDPRVPYTSKNGSASIQLPRLSAGDTARLIGEVRGVMRAWFVPGSDPGLCVAAGVPGEVIEFGRRCQREVVMKAEARALAARAGIHLEGIGGTEQGMIGALAAVGLIASGDDGRVVQLAWWPHPDDFAGPHTSAEILARGVDDIRRQDTGARVSEGTVIDVGKHLRPNVRGGRIVLFVEPSDDGASAWRAVKLP